jgi:UDP-GlcNAc3NAcA epimerase
MKILTVVGARPQFIKAAAVSRVLRSVHGVQEVLLHTGQHYDPNMSSVFFEELGIPAPEYNLGVGSGSHALQTAQMLTGIEEVLIKEQPDRVMVYGDTNSTMAGALSAVKLNIPVAHVEAGLRSFNHAMPEEINRIVTDRISDLLFAPTLTAVAHLEKEGLAGSARFTGDVMYDSLLYYREVVRKDESRYAAKGIDPGFLLATIHRAENTDHVENLVHILEAFASIGGRIILPIHPRTRKSISGKFIIPSNVSVIDPVGYLEMLWLTMNSVKVLTDSGGLQKEAYLLGKPCVTIRTETEWTETVHDGWNVITGTDPAKILEAANAPYPSAPRRDAFGNGKASEIITDLLTS